MSKEFCEECGAALPDGARFCEECGAAVAEIQSAAPVVTAKPHAPPPLAPPPPPSAEASPPSPPPPPGGAGASGSPAPSGPPSGRLWRALAVAALLLALGGGGYWLLHRAAETGPQTTSSTPSQNVPSQTTTTGAPDAKAKAQQAQEAAAAKRREDRDRRMQLVEQGARRYASGDLAGGRGDIVAALKGGDSVFYPQDGPVVDKARKLLQAMDEQLERQRNNQAAAVASDGNYSGTFTGPTKGSLSFRIDGRQVQGKIWNNDMKGSFRGQFDPQNQRLLCDLSGKIFFIDFTGALNGFIKGGQAQGNWRATGIGTEAGTWSAVKAR